MACSQVPSDNNVVESRTNATSTQCNLAHTLSVLNNPKSAHVMVAAHRGGHKQSPENSTLSIEEAINSGADIVEVDVQLTKDGVPVLMHDETIDRTTTGVGIISDISFKELRKFRLIGPDENISEEIVPTFKEILEVAGDRIMVHIDLKDSSSLAIEAITKLVKQFQLESSVSFYHKDTAILATVYEKLPTAYLMPMGSDNSDARKLAKKGFKMVHIKPAYMSKDLSIKINHDKSSSWVNALHEPDRVASKGFAEKAYAIFASAKVDIIQTDEPTLLVNFLSARNLRSCSN